MARGESLEEAAAHYGMELWRAKAIFVRSGLPVPKPIRHRRPRAEDERALGARIHSYLEREDNASTSQVAAALRTTRAKVLEAVWPQDEHRLRPALKPEQKYPTESILIALQAMSLARGRESQARGRVPVTASYWDAHRDPGVHPAASVVRARFGSWTAACEAAGVPVAESSRTKPIRHWSEEECLAAVQEFFAGGHGWGSAHYEKWSRDRDVPSVTTVLSRLGSWPKLRKRVLGR